MTASTHLERAKAKLALARKEPRDDATDYLADAIESLILAQEAIALVVEGMAPVE